MTQTKAEQLAGVLTGISHDMRSIFTGRSCHNEILTLDAAAYELRRLSPMEMELAGTKAASIARQTDLMGKNKALKTRVKELEVALKVIVQHGDCIDVDCGEIARKALAQTSRKD